jgi:hypothetical protein
MGQLAIRGELTVLCCETDYLISYLDIYLQALTLIAFLTFTDL